MITQSRLKELLRYDPDTGEFWWIVSRSGARCGRPAGSVGHGGHSLRYRTIEIDGKQYKAHRLAWLYVTGGWPLYEIDHIDRDGLNNRWINLRDVSKSVNKRNGNPYKDRGHSGVYLTKAGKYQVAVRRDGKLYYGGQFADIELAAFAAETLRARHDSKVT